MSSTEEVGARLDDLYADLPGLLVAYGHYRVLARYRSGYVIGAYVEIGQRRYAYIDIHHRRLLAVEHYLLHPVDRV